MGYIHALERSDEKREHDRAQNLCVGEEWLKRDGYKKDAEILRRLRNYVSLARLWVILLIRRDVEDGVSIDAYLYEGIERPGASKAMSYILGREPSEDDDLGVIIKGPFLWPDLEDDLFIPETSYGERSAVGSKRSQEEKETIRNESVGAEYSANPRDPAPASQEA